MDFAFAEDQQLLRDTTRRFLEAEGSLTALRSVIEAPEVVDREQWRRGADLGWIAMLVPVEHGGGSITDQPVVDLLVLAEELGRVLHPGPFVPTNVVADAIGRSGSATLCGEWLPGLAGGERLAAWCLSGDGSVDAAAVDVVGEPAGEALLLNGVARFVHGATVADVLLVAVRGERGVDHVVVDCSSPGIRVRPMIGLDLTRRYAEVHFDAVTVPVTARIGGEPATVLERAVALATVLQAAEAVGAADHLVSTTVQYAKDRVQFGRPIGSFQAIKHRLADLAITLEAMRAATQYAALALGDGYPDAAEAVHTAGSYVAEAFSRVCGEALQLHGGIGFTWEHDIHLFLRRAKSAQELYGDPAWHRESLCRLLERAVPDTGPGAGPAAGVEEAVGTWT